MGFLADNRNKLLAVFAAGLMVAFTLPSSFKGNGGSTDPVRATLGGQKIHVSDWKAAKDEYDYVMHSIPIKNDPQGRSIGLAMIPRAIHVQMQQHPDMYFLVLRETQRLGIVVPQNKVDAVLTNEVELNPNLTLDEETSLRVAVGHLLAIRMAMDQAVAPIKISSPLRDHYKAQFYQLMNVKLAEFDAADFKSLASAPTTQQVQDQFTAYGNKDPQAPDPRNTYGFGYRFPNRIKYQWIEIRRSDVLTAAKATHSDYDWDVAAQKYYRTNQSEFPSTAPASQPVVGANPGFRPFAEVHQQILDKLQNAEADRLESAILARLTSLLNADYNEFKSHTDAPPKTSFGVAFNEYAYLEKIAGQIQSEFKILPAVVSMGDYKTQQQIAETAIGKAQANSADAATILTTQIEPLVTTDEKSHAIKLNQPTPAMRDEPGNVYIARVTDAQAARMAASLADVRDQIDSDLKTVQAFTLARDAARGLATAAQKSSLDKAATLANRKVISAGPYSVARLDIPGYFLPPESATKFIIETSNTLLSTDPSIAHPLTIVELPRAGKVAVVELQDVISRVNSDNPSDQAAVSAFIDEEITHRYSDAVLQKWLMYDQIAARLDYQVDESGMRVQKQPTPAAEGTPTQSPFQ